MKRDIGFALMILGLTIEGLPFLILTIPFKYYEIFSIFPFVIWAIGLSLIIWHYAKIKKHMKKVEE
jgi:hypothetical protein